MNICRSIFILSASVLLAVPAYAQEDLQNVPDPDPQLEKEALQVPEGYEINLFASEPMIAKPIQINWDAQGRLWVASSTSYPQLLPGQTPDDKIYVLEDTDGDGEADKSTLFADGLLTPTGLAPGDGGVYVANSTQILHLEDTDGDGKADERRVVLSGFGTDDTHHLIHTFRWGPDGWLYLNQSIYIYSNIQTPWGIERLHGGGIWRLQPHTLELDIFARGFINPWGHIFDRWGQSFVTDGAGQQGINYVFPGAQFEAAEGVDRTLEGLNSNQPKHSGLGIISGRHFPDSLQGHMITSDFRANRVNRFVVTDDESGYASEKVSDLVWTDHVAFRPVDALVGPDGALYIADWYNPIIQHGEVDFRDPRRDRSHGRIWRITAKDRELVDPPSLADASVQELVDALTLPEAWTRQQAKRLLKERGAEDVMPVLEEWVEAIDRSDSKAAHHQLEALWVVQGLGEVAEPLLRELLVSEEPRARAAAVRVLYYWEEHINEADELLAQAVTDDHPRVRREAVTALQKGRSAAAARSALSVLDRPMDRFLDFALWKTIRELEPYWQPALEEDSDFFDNDRQLVYALKSVETPEAVQRLSSLYQEEQVPEEYGEEVLRVIAENGSTSDLGVVFDLALAGSSVSANQQLDHLRALEQAAAREGRQPNGDLLQVERLLETADDDVQGIVARLAGHWKQVQMRDRLQEMARSDTTNQELRKAAVEGIALLGDETSIETLIGMGSPDHDMTLRRMIVDVLPSVDADEAASLAVALFNDMPSDQGGGEVFAAFFDRPEAVEALANALQNETIPEPLAKAGMRAIRSEIPSYRRSDDGIEKLEAALEESGGALPPPTMPQNLDEQALNSLERDIKATADYARGEKVYRRPALMCASCHAIGGAGGQGGPDLSSIGASAPIDYLIESLLEPNKAVKDGYSQVVITKTDGSVVSGILQRETSNEVVLRDAADQEVVVPRSQIEQHQVRSGSVMPPGLTSQLTREEFVDLVGFLSKLGETEEYSVPEADLVRRWRVLERTDEVDSLMNQGGVTPAVTDASDLPWQPSYSTVSGELPLEDLPIIEVGGEPHSFAQFEVEVQSAGDLRLGFDTTEGLSLWIGQRKLEGVEAQTTIEIAEGIHRVIVAVNRGERGDAPLRIEVLDSSTSSARVNVVSGK